MNRGLSDALFLDGVTLDTPFQNLPSIAAQLALTLMRSKRASDPIVLKNAILNREHKASTYVDHGLAMPHFMSASVHQSSILMMRLNSPMLWDETDSESHVRLILCLALSKSPPPDVLRFCAQLACASLDPQFCQQLLKCQTAYAVLRQLSKIS